jgi:simple sugar transport system ATP-binding protein
MEHISKKFGNVFVNEGVDFTAHKGEIHALLGENGAGKTTLMNILTGFYKADFGHIFIDDKEVKIRSPKDAINLKINYVSQHFKLINRFSVLENIILGLKGNLFINKKAAAKGINELIEKYNLNLNVDDMIWQLAVGEQQRVEIAKMLYRGTDILILDEPTAVLTQTEVKNLYDILRGLANNGCIVIIITHKMHEVMAYCDTVTVLRKGKSIATVSKKDADADKLSELMVGKKLELVQSTHKCISDEVVLRLEDLCCLNDKGLPAVDHVSLKIRSGEILAIAGVSGNGQKELSEAITGLRKIENGQVTIFDSVMNKKDVRSYIKSGVAFIPEDRLNMGLAGYLSILDNSIIRTYYSKNAKSPFLIDYKKAKVRAGDLLKKFNIKTQGLYSPASLMSGGNLQKLLLARELSMQPKLIVAVYPTRGLDIGAADTINRTLLEEKEKGAAILLISEDLEDIFKLADSIGVIYKGRIDTIMKAENVDIVKIGSMMAGSLKREGIESDKYC